jgi:hypothetical protein
VMETRAPGRVPASRASREELRRRRRSFAGLVGLAVLVIVVLVLLVGRGDNAPTSAPTAPESPPGSGPSELLALSVTGSGHALLAVIGAGGSQQPAVMVLPPSMQIVVPGQGEASTDALRSLSGDSMRIAVSNAIGAWAERYAVTDLKHVGDAVDSIGGLSIDLPGVYTVGSIVMGPGKTTFSGSELVTFLYVDADDQAERWRLAVQALLREGALTPEDFTDSDDASGAASLMAMARDTDVIVPDTQIVAGTVLVPQQPDFDTMVQALFGTAPPVPVIVQNGNGVPGSGEAVARRLLPAGFRVVLSQNAESFDHDVTEIAAVEADHQDDAERAREALGVGTVSVSQVPSNLADITIVVGKDFTA